MNNRERNLAILVGSLLFIVFGYQIVQGFVLSPMARKKTLIERKRQENRLMVEQISLLQEQEQTVTQWKGQSLPPDHQIASNRYQEWLLQMVSRAAFKRPNIAPERRARNDSSNRLFSKHPFTIRANTSLKGLVTFLYEFYRTPLLHKITQINVLPDRRRSRSGGLNVMIRLEGVAIGDIPKRSILIDPDIENKEIATLAFTDFDSYQSIVDRKMFSPYQAPPPEREETPPVTVDHSANYRLTFVGSRVLENREIPEAWLHSEPQDETLYLKDGEDFEIPGFRAKVVRIGKREITLKMESGTRLLKLGKNLGELESLEGDATTSNTPSNDEGGQDESGQDEDGQDEDGQNEDGQDEDGQDEDGQNEDGQDEDGQDEDGQDEDGQNEDGQNEDGQP